VIRSRSKRFARLRAIVRVFLDDDPAGAADGTG
jgi:hypothetical protein